MVSVTVIVVLVETVTITVAKTFTTPNLGCILKPVLIEGSSTGGSVSKSDGKAVGSTDLYQMHFQLQAAESGLKKGQESYEALAEGENPSRSSPIDR